MDEDEEIERALADQQLYETPPPTHRQLPAWLRCMTIGLLLVMLFNLLAFLLFVRW